MLRDPRVEVRLSTLVREIRGDGGVEAVVVEDRGSGRREVLPVQGVFVFIGLVPNSDLVRDQLDLDPQGAVVTGPRMETRLSGVYAAGDVRRGAARQIVTAAADGALAALSAIEYLERRREAA